MLTTICYGGNFRLANNKNSRKDGFMGSINKVLFLNLLILLYFLFSIVASQPYFVPEVKILTKLNLIASPVMDDFLVNDDTGTFKQCVPAIAADDSGNFVIIWEDDRDGSKYVYVQRYGSSGIPWGNNFRVYADSGTLRQRCSGNGK